jgi:exonuclease SbcD
MSSNFIITGDLHYRLQNPKARLDDYREALEYKLSEVYKLAEKHKAHGIIIPGDLFDSASISIPGIYSLAKLLSIAPCSVVTIPGNHDGYGHNLDSIARTPYGLLRELEYINCVHDMPISVHGADVPNIHISGHGYNTETDNNLTQYCLPNDVLRGINIHVTHGMLLEKPMMEGVKHTLLSDLEKLQNNPEVEMPHVLINGHYHFGLPLTRVGKTLVINPGALGRLTAHMEEINREVKVALLTINGADDYNAKFIPLKSAQPGHVVLSREHIEEAKQRDERLDTFLKLLASEGEQKYLELEEIMEGIAKKENIPEEVVKEGLLRLGQAREIIAERG